MTAAMASVWTGILRAVHRYPSPHNSQPIRVRINDEHRAELYYDLARGLPAEPYGIPFGHVCAGVVVELLVIAAHAQGFEVVEDLRVDDMDFAAGDRLHPLGRVTLVPCSQPPADIDIALIARRRTSRTAYDARTVPADVLSRIDGEARRWSHRLASTTDSATVRRIVRINQCMPSTRRMP